MTAVEAWAATAFIFGIALIWGPRDADVGVISVIGLTWFLAFDIGWITASVGSAAFTLALVCLFCLAILNYAKKREARLL